MLFRLTVVAAALSASSLLFAAPAAKYDIAVVPFLCDPLDATKCGEVAFAYGLNNDGVVAGMAQGWLVEVRDINCETDLPEKPYTARKFDLHAIKWQNGQVQPTDLGHLGNEALVSARKDQSRAYGINNNGDAVGNSVKEITPATFKENGCVDTPAVNQARGFIRVANTGAPDDVGLPTQNTNLVSANDISDNGYVVGMANAQVITADENYYTRAFVRSPLTGNVTLLPALQEKSSSVLRAINQNGTLAVGYSDKDGITQAIQVDPQNPVSLLELGTLGGASSEAYDVNDAGFVVGRSYTTENLTIEAFIYDPNATPKMRGLGQLDSRFTFSQANAINASRDVVGTALATSGIARYHAMIVAGADSSAKMIDLNTRINCSVGAEPRWELTEAVAINDSGQIVGYGSYGGQIRSFLLTPSNDTAPIVPCEPVQGGFENKSGGGAFAAVLVLPLLFCLRRRRTA